MSVLVAQQDEGIDQINKVAIDVEADTGAGYVTPPWPFLDLYLTRLRAVSSRPK